MAFFRAGQQPIDEPFIRRGLSAQETILATIDALDLKFLPRLDVVPLPDLGGQYELPLRRNSRLHAE